jgi:hypothetical protein
MRDTTRYTHGYLHISTHPDFIIPRPPSRPALTAAGLAHYKQWLGVQVPRERNLDADLLSHPSRFATVYAAAAAAGLTAVRAPIPVCCWAELRAIVQNTRPDEIDDLA